MSALRALIAAMPDIARALEGFSDPDLKFRAFDVLINAAQEDARNGSGLAGGYMNATGGNADTTLMPRINDGGTHYGP